MNKKGLEKALKDIQYGVDLNFAVLICIYVAITGLTLLGVLVIVYSGLAVWKRFFWKRGDGLNVWFR